MRNLSILAKLLLVLAAFGIFAVGSTIFSAVKINSVATGFQSAFDHQAREATATARTGSRLNRMRAAFAELELAVSEEAKATALKDIRDSRAVFIEMIEEAAQVLPAAASELEDFKQRVLTLVDVACGSSIATGSELADAGHAAAQRVYLAECGPGFLPLVNEMSNRTRKAEDAALALNVALTQDAHNTIWLTLVAMSAGLFTVVVGGYYVIRTWISTPLIELGEVMGRLSAGNLDTAICGLDRADEIGLMSRAVQVFKEAGIDKRRLERQAEHDRAAAEMSRENAERERALQAEEQAAVVHHLAGGLGQLAKGDLTRGIDTSFAPEYERLRTDFNAAVAELQSTMMTVASKIGAIRSGTGEISTASDDLARRTEQQAASLEETAAALDHITTTVKRTADDAGEIQTMVSSAKTEAESGESVVRNAVAAMTELENSAKEITQIIGMIDEISFQTNLLALNAGVEAARAGETGRGFAVVASEVRALAQRSADAAKEIKVLISASTSQVGQGVKLVGNAGQALSKILGHVNEIDHGIGNITASARDQAGKLAEINQAVSQMDSVTQQNAAMVEESTAASHGLADEASELEQLIARFKIDTSSRSRPGFDAANANPPPRFGGSKAKPFRVVDGDTFRERESV